MEGCSVLCRRTRTSVFVHGVGFGFDRSLVCTEYSVELVGSSSKKVRVFGFKGGASFGC